MLHRKFNHPTPNNGSKRLASPFLIVVFQSINILLIFALWTLAMWQGALVLVYVVPFIFFIQIPIFCHLAWKKRKILRLLEGHKIKFEWLQKHSSLLIISGLLILDSYTHFTNPFSHDDYTIEVIFNPDESCVLSFDKKVFLKGRASYHSGGLNGIFCQGSGFLEDELLFYAYLNMSKNEKIQPQEYELEGTLGYSGYFINKTLGSEYSPSFVAPVYWGLLSGVLEVTAVRTKEGSGTLAPEVITGKLKVSAKRRHESNFRFWPL